MGHDYCYAITDYGAAGDGKTDDTAAFEKAIEAAGLRGGTVLVPPGIYLTGPIRLRSRVELLTSPGSEIRFVSNPEAYPIVESRWGGNDCFCLMPMIFADGAENVSIRGKGVINGCGDWWWLSYKTIRSGGSFSPDWPCLQELEKTVDRVKLVNRSLADFDTGGGAMESGFLRPPLIQVKDCRNVTIEGVTCINSAFWNCHLLYSEDITIHDARFVSPPDSPNTDGMDIDSCRGVRISDCSFSTGDDCLCLKSGIGRAAMAVGRPTEEIVISNCTMLRGHGGIVLGSEIAGGIRNIVVSGCVFKGTDRGIRLKTRRGRGGYVINVRISDIVMTDVGCPFVFNMFYKCGTSPDKMAELSDPAPRPLTGTTPYMRNILISGVISSGTRAAAGVFYGLPEAPIRGVSITNSIIEMASEPAPEEPAMSYFNETFAGEGFIMKNVCESRIDGCRVIDAGGKLQKGAVPESNITGTAP